MRVPQPYGGEEKTQPDPREILRQPSLHAYHSFTSEDLEDMRPDLSEKRRSFSEKLLRRVSGGIQHDTRFGLATFNEPPNAELDIVFVHGITGHREDTWSCAGARPWPETLLPNKVPQARILSFGYDAAVIGWRSRLSGNRIGDHAKNLLAMLASHREVDGTNERPLVFVCHSLGGLVCQDALLSSRTSPEKHLQRILSSTRGILFLGTPHSGSDLAIVGQRLARLAGMASGTNLRLVEVLRRDSEVLARLQDDFRALLRLQSQGGEDLIKITCIYEEVPIQGIGEVVPKHSAVLPGYPAIGVHANHRDIARFHSEMDIGFVTVANELRRWAKDICESHLSQPSVDLMSTSSVDSSVGLKGRMDFGGIVIHGNVLQSNVVNGGQVINGGLWFGEQEVRDVNKEIFA